MIITTEMENKMGEVLTEMEETLQPHVLFVDHILESIFEYIGSDEIHKLLNLRLVCSHWNYYATKTLQKNYHLSFGGHKYNVGRLKAFLSEFELSNENFPVRRFRLFSDLFQECNKQTVVNFMHQCGPVTESLVVFKDINSDIEYTKEELSQFQFPQLKHFTFSDRRRSEFSLDANIQSFLFQIVSTSNHTLTSLSIKFPREPIYEIYEKEELFLKIFSQENFLPHLKKLKLDMSITDKILNTLNKVNLKIKSLHLSLGASIFSSDVLKLLLTSLRFTLEELRLTDLYRRASLCVDLPTMNNLTKFEIHGLELPAYFVSFPDFSYANKMPNLRKLLLNTWAPIKSWENSFLPECTKEEEQYRIQREVSSVNELSLAMNFDCPMLMKRISSLFLGVGVLEMHFSRSVVPALQTVFQFMPQLTELKLNQSYLGEIAANSIDDVLTGLEVEECKWILKRKAYKGLDLSLMKTNPNLMLLKNLRKLDLHSLRHRNLITDVTAYLVFLKMNELRILDIGRSEFTDACLRDLAVKFPNGKFQTYLNKKKSKGYDSTLYRNSVFTSICAVQ